MNKQRNTEELEAMAAGPLEYEVRMLLCHAWEFLRAYPDSRLGAGLKHNIYDALLEAWLVHIRLLDDFLRETRKGRSAVARDWHPKWRSTGFLTTPDRAVVNDQLAHLSWDRKRWDIETRPPWDGRMREWTDACCRELLRLFDESPFEVQPSFAVPRKWVERWLTTGARPD